VRRGGPHYAISLRLFVPPRACLRCVFRTVIVPAVTVIDPAVMGFDRERPMGLIIVNAPEKMSKDRKNS
jgi:hypothetical protein